MAKGMTKTALVRAMAEKLDIPNVRIFRRQHYTFLLRWPG